MLLKISIGEGNYDIFLFKFFGCHTLTKCEKLKPLLYEFFYCGKKIRSSKDN
jgi:hypothetical protein